MAGFVCGITSFTYLATLGKINKNKLASYIAIKPACRTVLTKGLLPITTYLRDSAIIKDIEAVKFDLRERIRVSVLKLATAKDTYYFSTENERQVTYDLYLTKVTKKTSLKASVEATVIAGFDMNNFSMEVNHRRRELIISLPQPGVLSNEVSLSFSEPDKEIFGPSMNSDNYTDLIYLAKRKALEYAREGSLNSEAKKNARIAVMNIFQSIMELPQFNYKVRVVFNGELDLYSSQESN